MSLDPQGTEATALCGATQIVGPGYWLDAQWNNGAANYRFEGSLDATIITHAEWTFRFWPTNYATGVQLFTPVFGGLAVIPFNYQPAGGGSPNSYYPTVLPNLFLRDWGRLDASGLGPGDATIQYPGENLGCRVIHRFWDMIEHTDLAYGNADKVRTHRWTQRKRIVLRRSEALWFIWGGYNTHEETSMVNGLQCAGTFGYRHTTRE